jgi:hypothetical protein
MSFMALSDDAWAIDPIGFPGSGTPREKLAFLARYAERAPSNCDAQPWHLSVGEAHVDVVADLGRAVGKADPHYREITIASAAASETLLAAIRAYGFEGALMPLPDWQAKTLIARIGLGRGTRRGLLDRDLLHALLASRTEVRASARSTIIPNEVQTMMHEAAASFGVNLHLIGDRATKETIARLVIEADRVQFADPAFRQDAHSSSKALSYSLSRMAAALSRLLDAGTHLGRDIAEAPLLGVFTTKNDDRADWVAAGRAMAKVLHGMALYGLVNRFFNQPIEVETTRMALADLVAPGERPQLLSRLAYAKQCQRLPKRAKPQLKELLIAV